jgi:hypothetical protein
MKHLHNELAGALSQLSAKLQIPLHEITAIYSAELDQLADDERSDGVLGMLALRNTCLRLRDRIRG